MLCEILCTIVILILLYRTGLQETMTKIRRGVAFGNDADETPVAAGVVRSAPIFDMTYTYWDGVANASCDECPNKILCPNCPRYKETLTNYALAPGDVSPSAAPADLMTAYYADFSYPTTADVQAVPLDPTAIGDDEFEGSRARMGACVTKKQTRRRQYDVQPYDITEASKIDLNYREYTGSQGYVYRTETGL